MVSAAAIALLAAACGGDNDGTALASTNESPTSESPTTEQQPNPVEVDEAALQAFLDQWRTDVAAYGATLSLRVPGHDDIHLASGIDGREPETPMPTDGTYGAASITKSFVAATALQLVDEGRLSLDEPVEPWLPELPHADEVTLAMLLGHTAGLGNWELPDGDLMRSYTPEEALAMHLQVPPSGQPGERFFYTNAAYVAAGVLIERVLEQDLATVIAQRITEPFGLHDTQLDDGSINSIKKTRHGWYEPVPDTEIDMLLLPQQALMTSIFAAGNMTSSSADLLDWGDALYSGEFLGPEATATMLDMQSPFTRDAATGYLVGTDAPTRLHYGLGAMGSCLDPTGCSTDEVEVVGHSGSFQGYRTLLAHHPASGTTLVFFANKGDIPTPVLWAQATDLFEQLELT